MAGGAAILKKVGLSHGIAIAVALAAKAVVMLNYCGLDDTRIPWVADVSPHKQNRYLPGTRQRVVAPEFLIESKPEACVLFPWNIAEEITRRNASYIEQGGRFIIPIPEICVV